MKWLLMSLIVMFVAALPAVAQDQPAVAQDQPAKLSIVKTWDELRATPVLASGEFGQAQIGIEAVAAPRWGGVLVYCLVQPGADGKLATSFHHDDVLGPLDCRISRRGDSKLEAALVRHDTWRLPQDTREVLYTRAVMIDQPGEYVVQIARRGGKDVMAQCIVVGNNQVGHAWLPFTRGERMQRKLENDDQKIHSTSLTTQLRGIALPTHDGMFPIAWLAKNQLHANGRSLPRLIPRHVSDELKLSGDSKELMLESESEMIVARPDWHYLARWWVNDKPVIPEQPNEQLADQNGLILSGRRVRIHLTFKPADIGAKSGDKIGLQLLHLPNGWHIVAPYVMHLAAAHNNKPTLPRLTNRIEFMAP